MKVDELNAKGMPPIKGLDVISVDDNSGADIMDTNMGTLMGAMNPTGKYTTCHCDNGGKVMVMN